MKKFEVGKQYKEMELILYGMKEVSHIIEVIRRTDKTIWFIPQENIIDGYITFEKGKTYSRKLDFHDGTTERIFLTSNWTDSLVIEAKGEIK